MSSLAMIFDRSAFHGDNFDLLMASSLLKKVRQNAFTIHHTPVLLEETLAVYGDPKHHAIAVKQVPFILEICNGSWLEDREDLWQKEMVENRGPKTNPFSCPASRARAEARIRDILKSGDISLLKEAFQERSIERGKIDAQEKLLKDMRKEIAQKKREQPHLKQQGKPSFQGVLAITANQFASDLICRKFSVKKTDALACQWRKNKSRYPYFTSFVHGMLYGAYHAMVENNVAIDRNTQPDIEQLSYLLNADIIVSNDLSFQYSAFCELWKPEGKLFFTTERLLKYIQPPTA